MDSQGFDFNDSVSVSQIKDIYNKMYNLNLEETIQYHPFDLKDKANKVVIEVKTRSLDYDELKYATMTYNKLIKAKEYITRNYKVFFVFILKNGDIYYYEYKGEDFKKHTGLRHGFQYSDNNQRDYFFISKWHLCKLDIIEELDF
jgi:hypothetical protein